MQYTEAVSYFEKFPMGDLSLVAIKKLLSELNNPENSLKAIHIAGTNGKGSVSNLLKNILMAQGYRVGIYNSPYISSPCETIMINHQPISKDDFTSISEKIIAIANKMKHEGFTHPSSFECYTAIAFQYFHQEQTDYVIVEAGMGGISDATNVFENPILSIITSISYDHMQFLGNTLELIAENKAGIIKPGSPFLIGKNPDNVISTILSKAADPSLATIYSPSHAEISILNSSISSTVFSIKTPCFNYPSIETALLGAHQIDNIALALTACSILKNRNILELSEKAILSGIKNTRWPLRCEYFNQPSPLLIDGAHNKDSIDAFCNVLDTYFKDYDITFLFASLSDKDTDYMLKQLSRYSDAIFLTEALSPRSLSVEELNTLALKYFSRIFTNTKLQQAFSLALKSCDSLSKKKRNTLLCCVGSLYLAHPISALLKG